MGFWFSWERTTDMRLPIDFCQWSCCAISGQEHRDMDITYFLKCSKYAQAAHLCAVRPRFRDIQDTRVGHFLGVIKRFD